MEVKRFYYAQKRLSLVPLLPLFPNCQSSLQNLAFKCPNKIFQCCSGNWSTVCSSDSSPCMSCHILYSQFGMHIRKISHLRHHFTVLYGMLSQTNSTIWIHHIFILYLQTLSLFDFIFPVQVEGRVVTFRNMLYAAELLVPCSNPKLEDKAMSAVREYFWFLLVCGEEAHYRRNQNFSMGWGGNDPEVI
jgi:hypothetical protein